MQNAAPIETRAADVEGAEGGAPPRPMTSLTQSKMHAVPPQASEQPVLPRRSALVIEILAFVLIAFLVVSALLFNLTAPRTLIASQPAVSVQLPPKLGEPGVAASAPAPAAPEVHPIVEAEAVSTTALPDVQPEAGADATPPVDLGLALRPAPTAEVAALPPADEPVAQNGVGEIAPPAAPLEETASMALPPDEVEALIRRGDELLSTGDIVAARSAYERAAAGGNRAAATGVAKTYDPIFLLQSGVRGLRGDPARAALWYAKAAAAGDRTAQQRLRQLRAQYPQ
ncbi:MAG TPA: hypothetical protein VKU84_11030 [Stellaceae bacterium]|nr:hypothetical protein [Stellaceae bacterium]